MAVRKRSTGRCGFTLIELLVVIGIISILAGLIVSHLGLGPGLKVACMNNLREIGIAALQYSNDHGCYPWVEGGEPADIFQLLVDEGLIDEPRIFLCPACTQKEADYNEGDFTLAPENVSYTYAAKPVTSVAPSRTMIAADAYWHGEHDQGHKNSINVLYKSCAVREVKLRPGDTWDKVTDGKLRR